MRIEDCEDLIRTQAEELAEALLGSSYYDLVLELQMCVRVWAIEALQLSPPARRRTNWDPSFVSVPTRGIPGTTGKQRVQPQMA